MKRDPLRLILYVCGGVAALCVLALVGLAAAGVPMKPSAPGAAAARPQRADGYHLAWKDDPRTDVMVIAPSQQRSPEDERQAALWAARGELVLVDPGTKVWRSSGKHPFAAVMVEIAEGPDAGFRGWVPIEALQGD